MNVLIVDNELMPAKHLEKMLLKHCPMVTELTIFQSPKEALLHLKKHHSDVVFLDIEMPEMNGFEFIEIAGIENLPPVIFTTAYSHYAVRAFKFRALDYLLKPVDPEELVAALNQVETMHEGAQHEKLSKFLEERPVEDMEHLVLTTEHSYRFVGKQDIIRAQGNGSYTEFYLVDGEKVMTSKHLNYYKDVLLSWGFVRTHQSHLINLSFVEEFDRRDGGELRLKEGNKVPVSTRLKKLVFRKLGIK